MTVNNAQGSISFDANGSTTEWVFNFPAVDGGFIEVFVTTSSGQAVQLPGSQYQVILNPLIGANPTSQGGKVIFPLIGPPLGVGNTLTIVRNLPVQQNVSISNQSIIYPPIIEQEFDYLTLLSQVGSQDISRAFKVGFNDPIPALVPPVAQRASHNAFFDSEGNLTPGTIGGPGVFISAAMQPVVQAATLPLARQLMGISPIPFDVTTTFVVSALNDRQVVNLTGDFYTVTVGDPTGFLESFWTFLYNTSLRGKSISLFGFPTFILWPGQFVWVFNTSAGWAPTNPGRWKPRVPVGFVTDFYVNPISGNDLNDGLATGTGAFQTIQHAVDVVEEQCDGGFTINLADGSYNVGTGVVCDQIVPGAPNGYSIIGNTAAPSNVIITPTPGPNWAITVVNNAVVTIRGISIVAPGASGLRARLGAVMTVGNVHFGTALGTHMLCISNATLNVDQPYTIVNGAGDAHIYAVLSGSVYYNPGTVTLTNGMTFTNFIVCQANSTVHTNNVTQNFVNAGFATGTTKYHITYASVIFSSGTVFPGDIAGITAAGGYYA